MENNNLKQINIEIKKFENKKESINNCNDVLSKYIFRKRILSLRQEIEISSKLQIVKPFLKWVGGKTQLLNEIKKYYPFHNNQITKYAEPFVGGGAVLFDVLSKYKMKEIYISDINAELINVYSVIKHKVKELIPVLQMMEKDFLSKNTIDRKWYYLIKKNRFNELKAKEDNQFLDVEKAALMIFLNKTCFNGLYRVNKKGLFNVSMGHYKNPKICDLLNLEAISKKLKNVNIIYGDYKKSEEFIDKNTFVYFDPPYRPITSTSSFTAYNKDLFNDQNQKELAAYINKLNKKGTKILLSNSDPKNSDKNDTFFDEIYSAYNIKRVRAKRMINSDGSSRGEINELLISNFDVNKE